MTNEIIPVVWLSYHEDTPTRGYWDQAMLEDYFKGLLYEKSFTFMHHDCKDGLPDTPPPTGGAVVVLPARYHAAQIDKINRDLAKLDWVVLFLVGDEEGVFPYEELDHPNLSLWVMTADPERGECHHLINGYTPQASRWLKKQPHEKTQDFFFSGQNTHARREECVDQLSRLSNGTANGTEGFTQGLDYPTYFRGLASARVAPCPSGPQTPDTFRLWEALQAGAIPIADDSTPERVFEDYWTFVLGEEPPFPVIRNYESLPGYIEEMVKGYPKKANEVGAWWIKYKRSLSRKIDAEIERVSGIKTPRPDITVIMPTSPISKNPSTEVIEETISTVRAHLPEAEIIVTCDRPKGSGHDYDLFIQELIHKCNHEWRGVTPLVFKSHQHQARMTRAALEIIETPLICYVEHDAPLVPDATIPWGDLADLVLNGTCNVIRFHHEAQVHPEHQHLMLDKTAVELRPGVPLKRLLQWSQRPHLASAAYYRSILANHFDKDEKSFIEDIMHSVIITAHQQDKEMGWNLHRLYMYHPIEGSIQRSYHLDGRKS